MSKTCDAKFTKELTSRMAENVVDLERTEIRWAQRINCDDYLKIERLRRDLRFLLKGFGEFQEIGDE